MEYYEDKVKTQSNKTHKLFSVNDEIFEQKYVSLLIGNNEVKGFDRFSQYFSCMFINIPILI